MNRKVFDFEYLGQWLRPEVTRRSREGMTAVNMRMIRSVSPLFLALTFALLALYSILYIISPSKYALALPSICVCTLLFVITVYVSCRWERNPFAVSRFSTRVFTELIYWLFSAWGMVVSWRMYMNGSQMLIIHTVQIGFMLLVCCYPLWGVIRVMIVYLILYILMARVDGAPLINSAIYCLMIFMICFGTVLRYGMELRNMELVRGLNRYTRSLERSSTHDELTGMKNRAALRNDFPSYCGKHITVIMSDVDHFKRYNDTYGHQIGDQILKAFAAEITTFFGEHCSYRYGGDEFLIIVEGKTKSEVSAMLLVWSEAISNIRLEVLPEENRYASSYGFASGRPSDEEKLRRMVISADKRLYEMKASRRSC